MQAGAGRATLDAVHTARQLRYSYEDYLRALEDSDIKLEYSAGVIYAMAGGTLTHAALGARVIRLLDSALAGRCIVMTSDAKVRVELSDFAAFPDVSVVCGEPRTSPVDAHALTNPTLLVEVTSRSTEAYDRGEKLTHYQSLPSLRAVLVISHRERRVTLVSRDGGRWETRDVEHGAVVVLSPDVQLDVADVYSGIELEPA